MTFTGFETRFPLHELISGEEYYVGVFLVGAYQETLGDLHNLFGDTNVVSIRVGNDGRYSLVRELEGDTVADVLTYVEYEPKNMLNRFLEMAERRGQRTSYYPTGTSLYHESLRGGPSGVHLF